MIGIFDSGVGGLSVWREIRDLLPKQNSCYVADEAYCPYGEKTVEEVQVRSFKIATFLIQQGANMIVVACNTATAAAIKKLREAYPTVPIVGMEPAVKPAALQTKTQQIGLLATAGTLQGRLFQETRDRFTTGITLHAQVGHGLVELVESGKAESPEAEALLRTYLNPMVRANIDHLVLGCTHYPFLEVSIRKTLPPNVVILNPARAVARQVMRRLQEAVSSKGIPKDVFFTTGKSDNLQAMLSRMNAKSEVQRIHLRTTA